MNPRMSAREVGGRRGKGIAAVGRESEVAAAEGIRDVGAAKRLGWFLRVAIRESVGTAVKEAYSFCYSRLEESAVLRMCRAMRREDLAEGEEGGESPASVSIVQRN